MADLRPLPAQPDSAALAQRTIEGPPQAATDRSPVGPIVHPRNPRLQLAGSFSERLAMSFGRRGTTPEPRKSIKGEPLRAVRARFNFSGLLLSSVVAAITFFVLCTVYVSVFSGHGLDALATRTILQALILTPVTGLFYLVSFSSSDAVLRRLSVADTASYALAALVSSCALVALFVLATGGRYYIILAPIAPGGLLGGVMLGRTRRRSSAGAV